MGSFFNHRQIRRAPPGGSGGMLPQKILKSWCSETSFLVFWEDKFCKNCSLNQLSFLCLFSVGVTSRKSSRLYFIFCAVFEIVLDIYHFQLSILIVCALHRHGSCVNPLGIARGQSHSNCYFSWKRCWLVFSYHGSFQVSKYIKYSAYTGCISLCITCNIKSLLNVPKISHISRKISQVSRFLAKSPDSRNKFVFLPKQPLLELSPLVYYMKHCDSCLIYYVKTEGECFIPGGGLPYETDGDARRLA